MSTAAERFARVDALFRQLLDLPPAAREAVLEQETRGRPDLRAAVLRLLAADEEAGSFIGEPLVDRQISAAGAMARVGRRVGSYRLLEVLGTGGMGTVYRAARADRSFDKVVALKLIRPGLDTEAAMRRFERERQILAQLEHPNIARLLDGGNLEDGSPFLVVEYVEGEPLDRFCDGRRLDLRERLRLMGRVLAAVEHAHQQLVVHRDLKPSNILVTGDGTPKLLDFGIAKLLDPAGKAQTDLTRIAGRALTYAYASPEQLRGQRAGVASDVYSLGVVLYELLTGKLPIEVPDAPPHEVVVALLETTPPRPSQAVVEGERAADLAARRRTSIGGLRRRLVGDLDNIVMMALRKEPDRRYASVEQLDRDLDRHLSGYPVQARRDTASYRIGKFIGRHRLGLALLTAILAGVITFGATLAWQWQRIAIEQSRNERVIDYLQSILSLSNPESEPQSEGRAPTVAELLPRAIEMAEDEFADQPALLSRALQIVGTIYRDRGAYDEGIRVLERACGLLEEAQDPGDDDRVQCLTQQADALFVSARNEEAAAVYRQALGLAQETWREGHANTQSIRCALGVALSYLEHHEEALTILRRCSATIDRQAGADPLKVVLVFNQLGTVLSRAGELEEGESVLLRGLAYSRQNLGPTHFRTAAVMSLLARLYQRQGKLDEAAETDRQLIEIAGTNLPPNHPYMGIIRDRLGETLQLAGKHREALPHLTAAVAIRRVALTPDDPRLAASLARLGKSLAALGRYGEARPSLVEALAIYDRIGGHDQERATAAGLLAGSGPAHARPGPAADGPR